MIHDTPARRDHHFLLGLGMGTIVGASLAIWLIPRAAAELGRRATDSARELGNRASEGYQHASARVGDAVDDLTTQGQAVRDDLADAVVRGAHEVARQAAAVKRSR